jgi:hypothetical protein
MSSLDTNTEVDSVLLQIRQLVSKGDATSSSRSNAQSAIFDDETSEVLAQNSKQTQEGPVVDDELAQVRHLPSVVRREMPVPTQTEQPSFDPQIAALNNIREPQEAEVEQDTQSTKAKSRLKSLISWGKSKTDRAEEKAEADSSRKLLDNAMENKLDQVFFRPTPTEKHTQAPLQQSEPEEQSSQQAQPMMEQAAAPEQGRDSADSDGNSRIRSLVSAIELAETPLQKIKDVVQPEVPITEEAHEQPLRQLQEDVVESLVETASIQEMAIESPTLQTEQPIEDVAPVLQTIQEEETGITETLRSTEGILHVEPAVEEHTFAEPVQPVTSEVEVTASGLQIETITEEEPSEPAADPMMSFEDLKAKMNEEVQKNTVRSPEPIQEESPVETPFVETLARFQEAPTEAEEILPVAEPEVEFATFSSRRVNQVTTQFIPDAEQAISTNTEESFTEVAEELQETPQDTKTVLLSTMATESPEVLEDAPKLVADLLETQVQTAPEVTEVQVDEALINSQINEMLEAELATKLGADVANAVKLLIRQEIRALHLKD